MSHILFGLYTLLFGVALFSGEGGHMVFGAVTVLVLIGWLIRNLYLPARVGHYARKYLGFLLILLVVVPYLLLPDLAASIVCYAFVAGWLVGNATRHEITWSELLDDGRSVERVLIFLPGLCEWRFTNGGHAVTNGSTVREITFYEADAFVESRLS